MIPPKIMIVQENEANLEPKKNQSDETAELQEAIPIRVKFQKHSANKDERNSQSSATGGDSPFTGGDSPNAPVTPILGGFDVRFPKNSG